MTKFYNLYDISNYNFYNNSWPSSIDIHVKDGLLSLNNSLTSERPRFIDSLFIYLPSPKQKHPASMNFYIFSNLRNKYRILVKSAEFLSNYYLQQNTLPLIQPVTSEEWEFEIKNKGKVCKNLTKYGILLYTIGKDRNEN